MEMADAQLEANKKLITDFFAATSKGYEHAEHMLADDVVIWAAPFTQTKEDFKKGGVMLKQLYDGPLTMTVKMIMAEGDRVAAETESYGKLKAGRIYTNKYCWVFRVRNGKIVSIHEHGDTHHAVKTYEGIIELYAGQAMPTPLPWPKEP